MEEKSWEDNIFIPFTPLWLEPYFDKKEQPALGVILAYDDGGYMTRTKTIIMRVMFIGYRLELAFCWRRKWRNYYRDLIRRIL